MKKDKLLEILSLYSAKGGDHSPIMGGNSSPKRAVAAARAELSFYEVAFTADYISIFGEIHSVSELEKRDARVICRICGLLPHQVYRVISPRRGKAVLEQLAICDKDDEGKIKIISTLSTIKEY